MSLREHVSLREHACVSSRCAQSTELVSLYIGYWTLNNYYYYDLGRFTESNHNIELTEHTPIKQKYRRIPPHLFQAVKEEIDMLLDTGVIIPSVSPYSSPISIAVKKMDHRVYVWISGS